MNQRKPLVLHPFFFAAYPVLHLLSRNLDEVDPIEAVKPLLVVLVLSGFLFILSRALLKNSVKAGIVTSLLMLGILSYGHAFQFVANAVLSKHETGRTLVFLPVWCGLMAALAALTIRTSRKLQTTTSYMNLFGVVLVALALLSIGVFHARIGSQNSARGRWSSYVRAACSRESLRMSKDKAAPDIYYIILDECAGPDALESFVGLHDRSFIEFLKQRGFHVPPDDRSNYLRTYPSLASSLNMDYVQTLSRESGIPRMNDRVLGMMIRDSRVVRLLKDAGYRFVFFPSDYQATNTSPHADVVMARHSIGMSEFDSVFFATTVFQPFDGWSGSRREKILYTFDKLPEIAKTQGPKFVFAHITVPHAPYLFNADGSMPAWRPLQRIDRPSDEYRRLYIGQVTYAHRRLRTMIERILAESKTAPVIVLQGDHGLKLGSCPRMSIPPEIRCSIFRAYCLPGVPAHSGHTPVNTFRAVFDAYFGARYPLLRDMTYTDSWVGPVGGELRFETLRLAQTAPP